MSAENSKIRSCLVALQPSHAAIPWSACTAPANRVAPVQGDVPGAAGPAARRGPWLADAATLSFAAVKMHEPSGRSLPNLATTSSTSPAVGANAARNSFFAAWEANADSKGANVNNFKCKSLNLKSRLTRNRGCNPPPPPPTLVVAAFLHERHTPIKRCSCVLAAARSNRSQCSFVHKDFPDGTRT